MTARQSQSKARAAMHPRPTISDLITDHRSMLEGNLPLNYGAVETVQEARNDLLTMSDGGLRSVRGKEIGMVFQDPLSSLHPQFRVGAQIACLLGRYQRGGGLAQRELFFR